MRKGPQHRRVCPGRAGVLHLLAHVLVAVPILVAVPMYHIHARAKQLKKSSFDFGSQAWRSPPVIASGR